MQTKIDSLTAQLEQVEDKNREMQIEGELLQLECNELTALKEATRWISVSKRLPKDKQLIEVSLLISEELESDTGFAFGYWDKNHSYLNCSDWHILELKYISHFRPITLPESDGAK